MLKKKKENWKEVKNKHTRKENGKYESPPYLKL